MFLGSENIQKSYIKVVNHHDTFLSLLNGVETSMVLLTFSIHNLKWRVWKLLLVEFMCVMLFMVVFFVTARSILNTSAQEGAGEDEGRMAEDKVGNG